MKPGLGGAAWVRGGTKCFWRAGPGFKIVLFSGFFSGSFSLARPALIKACCRVVVIEKETESLLEFLPKDNMKDKILIIEDEPAIADNISYALMTEGFEPIHCPTGR